MFGKKLVRNKKGFTLIELLIVVAIIGILAAVGTSVIPGLLTNAKVNCANQSHQQIWENLKIRLMTCATGTNVTYGPFANRIPNTRTLNCSLISPNGYDHYHSADSHAYSMYLESQLSYKSCYDSSISAFGGTAPGGHGWSAGAGWANGTCNIPDKGVDLGQSVLGYKGGPALCGGHGGDNACLKTNVGDKNGDDKFLYSIIDICTMD